MRSMCPSTGRAGSRPKAGHPALFVMLGGVLTLGALIGAGLYFGRAEAEPTPAQETAAPASAPAPTAVVPAPTPPSVTTPITPSVTETVTTPPAPPPASATAPAAAASTPAPSVASKSSANAKATKPAAAKRVAPSQPGATTTSETAPQASAPPPPEPAEPAVDFDELETEIDQLQIRAAAVNRSLDSLQQAQARQGLGLRGDTVVRQESMNLNLTRTREALEQRNAARLQKFKALAESDVEALERFLGRR